MYESDHAQLSGGGWVCMAVLEWSELGSILLKYVKQVTQEILKFSNGVYLLNF